jgi:hypothetical protein
VGEEYRPWSFSLWSFLHSPVISFLYTYFKIKYVLWFYIIHIMFCGAGSSVGIATYYGLDGPGIENDDHSYPSQTTGWLGVARRWRQV